MKKTLFVSALLFCWAALSPGAQEGSGPARNVDISRYKDINIIDTMMYVQQFINKNTNVLAAKYSAKATDEDFERIASLDGDEYDLDTAEEIALLSATAGVINIRPAEAAGMLPAGDPVLVDLQLGAMLYMKKAAITFLGGGDPAKYAAELKFITDRGRVTEADIKKFMEQGIAGVVDAEFRGKSASANTISMIKQTLTDFFIMPSQNTYGAILNKFDSRYFRWSPDQIAQAIFDARRQYNALSTNAENAREAGQTDLAPSLRSTAQAILANITTLETVSAWFTIIGILNPVLLNKIQQDLRR